MVVPVTPAWGFRHRRDLFLICSPRFFARLGTARLFTGIVPLGLTQYWAQMRQFHKMFSLLSRFHGEHFYKNIICAQILSISIKLWGTIRRKTVPVPKCPRSPVYTCVNRPPVPKRHPAHPAGSPKFSEAGVTPPPLRSRGRRSRT